MKRNLYEVWTDSRIYGNQHLGDYWAADEYDAYNQAYNEHCDEHLDLKEVYVELVCEQCGNDPLTNTGEPCVKCGAGSLLDYD